MLKISTKFPEIYLLKPKIFKDNRGFLFESYSKKKYSELGLDVDFVQDNHSKSIKNTIRGLHYQAYPGQQKLIRCIRGKIWDIVVDIRPKSKSFRKWLGIEISEENRLQIYIPVGFAHGFSVISGEAEILYKVSNHYDPDLERTISWNDNTINIDWKVKDPIISKRDEKGKELDEILAISKDPFDYGIN